MKTSRKFLIFGGGTFLAVVAGIVLEYRRQIPTKSLTHYVTQTLPVETQARFLAIGDYGSGDQHQRAVAALLERLCVEQKPDAVLLLGDNFYTHGVKNTTDVQWQEKFEQMYAGDCLKNVKAYSVLGNHDYEGNPTAQIEYTEKQQRWVMPARYYKASFGNLVDVFAMDTNFPDRCGLVFLCGVDWIAKEIKNSTATWKFAMGHHPLISVGRHKRPKLLLEKNFSKVLCEPPVDAFFSGHDHNMQHLSGIPQSGECVIQQFISGGGGAELYPVASEGAFFAKTAWGAMTLDVNPSTAAVSFYEAKRGDEGQKLNPLYTYQLQKPGL